MFHVFVGSSPGVDDHDSLRRSGGKTTADHSGTEPSCDIRHVSYSTRVTQYTWDTDDTVHVCLCEFFARPAVAWWCVVNVLISCRCKIYHLAPMFANYWPGPAVAWPAAAQRSLHSLFGCPVSSAAAAAPRREMVTAAPHSGQRSNSATCLGGITPTGDPCTTCFWALQILQLYYCGK